MENMTQRILDYYDEEGNLGIDDILQKENISVVETKLDRFACVSIENGNVAFVFNENYISAGKDFLSKRENKDVLTALSLIHLYDMKANGVVDGKKWIGQLGYAIYLKQAKEIAGTLRKRNTLIVTKNGVQFDVGQRRPRKVCLDQTPSFRDREF